MNNFYLRSEFDVPVHTLFEWHMREGTFERLNPPWQQLYIISKSDSIDNGGLVKVKLPLLRNLGIVWKLKHSEYIKDNYFKDSQIKGLFSLWEHEHKFFDRGSNSAMEDKVNYDLPLGISNVLSTTINNKMRSMFEYRHRITRMDLCTHQKIKNPKFKNIIVSGSSGFIGSALIPFLTSGDYNVTCLRRRKHPDKYNNENIYWNSSDIFTNLKGNVDAVINLNGESILGIWTRQKKERIYNSRVMITQSLCKKLAGLDNPPKVLISASAIGFYGNDSGQRFDDDGIEYNKHDHNHNEDFFANLCKEWEEATDIAKNAGIRIVNLRIGVVLGSSGGILRKLTIMHKMKSSITINHSGWISWISLDDLLRIILFSICNEKVSGPLNATSPNPVMYLEFMETLNKILKIKLNLNIPSKIVKIAFGEMSKYSILSDIKAIPNKLTSYGFDFIFEDLESALRHTLGKIN